MELVRTYAEEKGLKRPFYSIGVDSRRPKTTWRRTVERERNKAGWKSWNVAKAAARNRECWSENVSALCAYWRTEI